MPVILCDAIPFCYGPASALLTLGQALACRGATLRAVAAGTTADLLEAEGTFDVIRTEARTDERIAALHALLPEADLYLNVMAPETYAGLAETAIPKVYVDFLFWMFSPRFARAEVGADLYLIENYPGSAEKLALHGPMLKAPLLVPPLVTTMPSRPQRPGPRRLLVCFGGLESPLTRVGVNTNYPDLMTDVLVQAIERRTIPYEEVVVTGERRTMERLARQGRPGLSFRSLSHRSFLEELARASALLTHPGLYTPFEGFAHGIPTFFLPSSNYTQILQLRFYRAAGAAPYGEDWEDLGITLPSGPIPEGLPEAEGVERVLQCIRLFEASPSAGQALAESLAAAFTRCAEDPASVVRAQRRFFEAHAWASGPEQGAGAICRLLDGASRLRRGTGAHRNYRHL